jgi:FG-GAP-like repeat
VLLGYGNRTFRTPVPYDSDGYDASVAITDVDGDDKLDVLVGNLGQVVGVLLGYSDDTFHARVTSSPSSASSIAVADVNGDGQPDFMVAFGTVGVRY